MRAVFWICVLLVVYAYVGYALWLWLLVRIRRQPIAEREIAPTVSIILAVRNEEANLPGKLSDIQLLDYPKDRIQIVVASNGSTDRTAEILRERGAGIVSVILEQSCGKAIAINEAVSRATGEILFFQDARQQVAPAALRALTRCFADDSVGAVSGELLLEERPANASSEGLGIYWKIEKMVRRLESASGSVVGATGAIYAVRRELFVPMPRGTILDDVFVPMHVALRGKRVVFQPDAVARDRLFTAKGKEFSRKVRTLTGNYQLLRLAPWLLTTRNPILGRFISHKMLRLLVPALLVVMLIVSSISHAPEMRVLLGLQLAFYLLAALGMIESLAGRFRPAAVARTFVILNMAAIFAFFNFISLRDDVWV